MTSEDDDKLTNVGAQQLIDESSERICFIPAKGDNSNVNSFCTLVVDDTLRDFVVCNNCSMAIPWKSNIDTDSLKHHCEPKDTIHGTYTSEFFVKVSLGSSPEKEEDRERDSSHFTIQDITALIENSSDRVRMLPKKGKSLVWKLFSVVEVDGIRQDYVFCNQCNIVTRWKPKDGTNNLRIHICKRHTIPPAISTSELFSESSNSVGIQKKVRESSNSNQITKRELQVLIDSCSARVAFIPGRGDSQVWTCFYLVKIDGEMTNFVICKECRAAIIWKTKHGTAGLQRHTCKPDRAVKKMRFSEFTQECQQASASCQEFPRSEFESHKNVSLLSKEEVQALIDESSERICLIPGRGKSDVWMTFSFVEVDGKKTELAVCNLCNTVVTWKSKYGTNGLRKHACKQIRLSQPPDNPPQCTLKTPSVSHAELEERLAMMCGMDLIPIDMIHCPGFINLLQYAYDLGANNGLGLNIKELLPSEKVVSRRVEEIAMMEKENIMMEVQLCTSFGVALDLWDHEFTSKAFVTITIHYILEAEDSLLMRNRVLYTGGVECNTEEFIREKTLLILKEFGVYGKNIYVISNDKNIAQAFIKERRIQCAGSGINLALRKVLDDLKHEEFPQLTNLLQACRTLLSLVRNTRIQKKLMDDEISLHPEHPGLWNSMYNMLQSVLNAMSKLEELLSDLSEVDVLYQVDRTLLEEMVKLLKPFDEATKLLTWNNCPTLPLVVPAKVKLQRCLELKEEDSNIIKQIKRRLSQALDENFQISRVHCVATLLHPKMKGFVRQYMGEERFENSKEEIACILANINGPKVKNKSEWPAEKKVQLEEDQSEFLLEVMSDCVAEESDDDEQSELSFYLNSKYSSRIGDPLNYWKKNASRYPNLYKVAKTVLAVPASGGSCARSSSEDGRRMHARRNCFGDDSMNSILFVHSAVNVGKRGVNA